MNDTKMIKCENIHKSYGTLASEYPRPFFCV